MIFAKDFSNLQVNYPCAINKDYKGLTIFKSNNYLLIRCKHVHVLFVFVTILSVYRI